MVPRTSRELLQTVRPVVGVAAVWAVVVLCSEFGIKNVGYHRPFSLIWWVGTLATVAASAVALAAVSVFVLAQGIALGVDAGDGHAAPQSAADQSTADQSAADQ